MAVAAQAQKKVLVTGANKGIGLAICKGLLEKGCFVYLGSRDVGRGVAARKSLVDAEPKYEGMLEVRRPRTNLCTVQPARFPL
jgi:NAD(P)-dependent dehydrogenase (short-subunit alcohol dehydrogenase family)